MTLASLRQGVVDTAGRAARRVASDAWPLAQAAIAATIAWLIARDVVGHTEPFFAPISAVIALNAPRGERGLNALRLIVGVIVGIVVGELTVLMFGAGYGRLAFAVFVAVMIARAIGAARIVVAQAASSAILTVVAAGSEAGPDRLSDALIGAGVALVFTQLIFSPDPVALVRRAERTALAKMAHGVELTAIALERDDGELATRATNSLRDLHDSLSELGRMRLASARVVRHSLAWRSRMTPVVRENESADHLDLLGVSCLMLARSTTAIALPERRQLVPSVRELADALGDVARDPGDRARRQAAVDRALDAARRLAAIDAPPRTELEQGIMSTQMVAADLMVFAGVEPDVAHAEVRALASRSSGELASRTTADADECSEQ